MDKRNQMENPFFDPDKPGSIFVGMDRYHQYSPHQPRNALTFIQKGVWVSTGGTCLMFARSNRSSSVSGI